MDPRESHHLIRVLRAREGAPVELLDGKGARLRGRIGRADAKAAEVVVDGSEQVDRPLVGVTLVQALPKGKTMDLILRMATEIGVGRVVPVFTEQGEVWIGGDRLAGKVEKWRTTMVEACKQCGLPFLPELAEPASLRGYLEANPPGAGELRLVASLEAGSRPLVRCLEAERARCGRVVVAVGPEGDFSRAEYEALGGAGFRPVRLGRNVLRAETAAAYILSVADQILVAGREGDLNTGS